MESRKDYYFKGQYKIHSVSDGDKCYEENTMQESGWERSAL